MTGDFPKKGDVYWVSLDPTIGSETKKTRPCLVISNDKGNQASNIIIIAPITSKIDKIYSFEVSVFIAGKKGKVMIQQCRAIDKSRLGKKECCVNSDIIYQVDEAIRITFGLS